MRNVLVPKDQLTALLTPMVAIQRGHASRKQREHKLRVARVHQFDDFLNSVFGGGVKWEGPCECGRNHKSLLLENGGPVTMCPIRFYLSMHNVVIYKIGHWQKWLEWMTEHPIAELLKPLAEGDTCYIDIPFLVLAATPEELKCLKLKLPT